MQPQHKMKVLVWEGGIEKISITFQDKTDPALDI